MFGAMAPITVNEVSERPSVSSKSSSISGTATIKQGGNKLMSKFFGNKSTTAKESTIEETSINECKQPGELTPGLITACPFIRPLEHKLQARSEPMLKPKLKARSFDTLSTGSSAFAIILHREEANRKLNSTLAAEGTEDSKANLSTMGNVTDPSTAEYQEHTEDNMETQISQHLEYIAVTAAEDSQAVHHWRYYIQCYSKGQFNLNDPPEPPPQSSSFQYLPAVFPPQEEARISAGHLYDIVWPNWSQGKANALTCAALKEFDTYFASLSFFDSNYEIFKAESGYNASRVSRSVSIAAHALLSDDVLVVLDTKKDWRFENNPLVCSDPKIRFFAGAPMLSSDGQPVGVFAIFSKEPRVTFSPDQRRELAGYSAMALKDLTHQALYLSDPELHSSRTTPLLERDSTINVGYRRLKIKSPPAIQIDHTLVPPGLRYHKVKTPPTGTPQVFVNRSPAVLSEHTPPSSSEGSENDTFPGTQKGIGKNSKQLSVNSDLNHVSSCGDMITPDSEGFRIPTPRPFSASDLTSLNPLPPNTPVLLSQDDSFQSNMDLTVENFMSLSDNDCAEQESSPLIDLSTPKDESNEGKTRVEQSLGPPSPSSRLNTSSISTMMTGESHESSDPMAEAAFSCSFSAQSLGYDLIYVVEIKPSRPFMTEKELFAPGGLQKRILVAYGLDRPMELSIDMHIRALRSRGYQAWENHTATYENGEYQAGVLIPLQTESTPYRKRSSGLVFGAFRRPKLVEIGDGVHTPAEDIQRLVDAATALEDILLKQPNSRRSPRKNNNETKSPNRYPTNKAVKLQNHLNEMQDRFPNSKAAKEGRYSPVSNKPAPQERCPASKAAKDRKHLLDQTPDPYPAGEAVEVGIYSRANSETVPQERYPANEAVEVGKPSIESGISTTTSYSATQPPSPDRKPSSKSGKSSKPKKAVEGGKKYSLDAGLDRPFHAISRFRPF